MHHALPLEGHRPLLVPPDGQRLEPDIVWSYPDPRHDAEAVHGLLCFVDERVELEVSTDKMCY